MDAVVLALASAALFGSMTVALRFALRVRPDAEAGALQTIAVALARHGAVRRRGRPRPRRRLAVPARRRARARRLAAPLHPRRPRRGALAHVGHRRDCAALLGRNRSRAPRRAGQGGRDRRRDPDRHRRDPARPRARQARAREVDRARLRARGDADLRRARQPRSAPLARHGRRAGARGRGDALRRRSDRRSVVARLASPAADAPAFAPSSCRASASASPTSASSRGTTAAASRSSRRSSRPSRSGPSRSPRSCCAGTSSSGRASSEARPWSSSAAS